MSDTLTRGIPATVEAVGEAGCAVDAFLAERDVDAECRCAVGLVVEELGSNVVRHGSADGAPHTIDVAVALAPREVTVTLRDDGVAFDPRTADAPDLEGSPAERPVGWLGIYLVRHMIAGMDYRREGPRNHLAVRVARGRQVPSPPAGEG